MRKTSKNSWTFFSDVYMVSHIWAIIYLYLRAYKQFSLGHRLVTAYAVNANKALAWVCFIFLSNEYIFKSIAPYHRSMLFPFSTDGLYIMDHYLFDKLMKIVIFMFRQQKQQNHWPFGCTQQKSNQIMPARMVVLVAAMAMAGSSGVVCLCLFLFTFFFLLTVACH